MSYLFLEFANAPREPLVTSFIYLQLNDVELSCLWKFTFVDETVGGQKVFLGTDTQLVFSPSFARASSRMNFPSKIKKKIREKLK